MTEHIILIGFKATGKTQTGKKMAKDLNRQFVDLDEAIVLSHTRQCEQEQTCRELMQAHGEDFFRELESEVLEQILAKKTPMILALGGGAPLSERNQKQLTGHKIIHVTAPQNIVFERIMQGGIPAFFPPETDAFAHFEKLWAARQPVYERLAITTIHNG